MESFIVSARKYRPLTFDSVVGQSSITQTLKNAIKQNHLAHAYLFCGPRGVGKTTCARIFAKTINCSNVTDKIEACGECESCKAFSESRSYNIHELDAASNNSVDDIRNLIDQVRIPPQIGKYSIYIIDEVHMLSQQAFNAFLKTLEEPPKHAVFILATTEKHKIIPTILSRCQIFDFNRIKNQDIAAYLEKIAGQEGINTEPQALSIIAQKADGAMRDALSIFDQIVSFRGKEISYKDVIENLNVLDYEYYFKITDFFITGDYRNSLLTLSEILDNGFDGQDFINGLSKHLRDLLVVKDEETLKLMDITSDLVARYKAQTKKCPEDFLFRALEITNQCDINYRISKNQRLHIELSLIKLCNLTEEKKKLVTSEEELQVENKKEVPAENKVIIEEPGKSEETLPSQPVLPVPPRKKAIQSSTKSIQSIPSIKEYIDAEEKEAPQPATVENQPVIPDDSESPGEANDFNKDDLKKAWITYAKKIEHEMPRMFSAMMGQEPEIRENFEIWIQMFNVAQNDEFKKEVKTDLERFLKQELKNYKIIINTSIPENKNVERSLYTPEEKFKYLAGKYPDLAKFKDIFDLDTK